MSSLTITVNAIDETSGRAFGRTRLDGGKLGVYVIRRLGIVEALRLTLRMATPAAGVMTTRWRSGCGGGGHGQPPPAPGDE